MPVRIAAERKSGSCCVKGRSASSTALRRTARSPRASSCAAARAAAARSASSLRQRRATRAQPMRGRGGGGGRLELPEASEGEAEESAVEGAHPISHLTHLRAAAAAARRGRARPARRLKGVADGAAAVDGVEARECKDRMRYAHQPTPSPLRLEAHPLDKAQRGGVGEAAPQCPLRPPKAVVGLVGRHEDQLRPLAEVVTELREDGDHLCVYMG
eukprot:scaffold106242_cov63-Phaeocystis_antarctica.AAC.11